jgi:hypothetical protein
MDTKVIPLPAATPASATAPAPASPGEGQEDKGNILDLVNIVKNLDNLEKNEKNSLEIILKLVEGTAVSEGAILAVPGQQGEPGSLVAAQQEEGLSTAAPRREEGQEDKGNILDLVNILKNLDNLEEKENSQVNDSVRSVLSFFLKFKKLLLNKKIFINK